MWDFDWPEESDIEEDFLDYDWPDESDDDSIYFYENSNEDLMVSECLNRKQLTRMNRLEEKNYQRAKRSHKKANAQRQIKTKYAQTIKIKSHNKHLYIHHRLAKKIHLDPPSRNHIPSSPSVPLYSPDELRTIPKQSSIQNRIQPAPRPPPPPPPVIPFREYTINESNIPNEPSFDDAMITFLLEMQNRDL